MGESLSYKGRARTIFQFRRWESESCHEKTIRGIVFGILIGVVEADWLELQDSMIYSAKAYSI